MAKQRNLGESDRGDLGMSDLVMVDGEDSSLHEDESKIAEEWLKKCKSHKHLKCVEWEVPLGILPQGVKGILIDVKVSSKGPDDVVYSTHKDLRESVARGNCVLQLTSKDKQGKPCVRYIFVIFALKKFSGGMGDEDDCPNAMNMWETYFLKPITEAKKVISTIKANGEAAHISCRKLFGKTYFCCGSKNVHMLVRNSEDISRYTDSRFQIARIVGETFFRQYYSNPNISNDKKQMLVDYLVKTKYVMVNEVLQPSHQHIEILDHLEEPEIRFICWTGVDGLGECDKLCVIPPHEAIDNAKEMGLSTVDYEVIDMDTPDSLVKIETYMAQIRSEFGYEGRVLYFLDDKGRTMGVLKKKTAWYIILRAIREKTCHFCSKGNTASSPSARATKVIKRIKEIQVWIGFSEEYCNNWIKLGTGFVEWTKSRRDTSAIAVRSQFPVLWKTFIESDEKWKNVYKELEASYS